MTADGGPEHGEVPLQVGLDDRVPLVLGHVEEHPLPEDAGHRHHPVDPAPPLDAGADDLLAAVEGGHALGHGHRLAAGGLDVGDQRLGHLARGVLAVQARRRCRPPPPWPLPPAAASATARPIPPPAPVMATTLSFRKSVNAHCLSRFSAPTRVIGWPVVLLGPKRTADGRLPACRPDAPAEVDHIREPVLASPPGRRHPGVARARLTSRPHPASNRRCGGGGRRAPWAILDSGHWPTRTRTSWPWSIPTGPSTAPASCSGRTNQVVHGLRGLSLQPGDVGRHPPPQRGGDVRALPGRAAGRLVPGPDQPPPDRSRGGLHPEGLGGQGVRRPRAVRRRGPGRRRRGRAPVVAVLRRRGDRRIRLLRQDARRAAHHRSGRPHHRRRHELHLGHHRQSQGGLPTPEWSRPRGGGHRPVRHPLPLRDPAGRRPTSTSSARRSTTPPCCATREPPSTCCTPWC